MENYGTVKNEWVDESQVFMLGENPQVANGCVNHLHEV